MQIDYNTLIAYGGVVRKLDKGAFVFHEGSMAYFFYQVVEGTIKVFSSNADGKELIQGMFTEGQSFGDPPLLLGKRYPCAAQAITESVVVKIGKQRLLNLLKDYPDITNKLLYTFAERLYNKATSAQIWVSRTPEQKILHFLDNTKEVKCNTNSACVPYTRQQIADFTGLRVETVIRTLIRMSKEGKVEIVDHKLYY